MLMAARGKISSNLAGRRTDRRVSDSLPTADLLENEIAVQAAEIERLLGENRILATSHVHLREDLIVAQKEAQRLKAHIKSIQTESDIQVRIVQDKIAKMEMEIMAGENVKKDLRQAHMEAQSLARARQELTKQIQEASMELQKLSADVKSLPDLHEELLLLRKEHKRLRETFEYEKGLNMEKVEQLKAMEQDLIKMAREVERLYDKISDVEKGPCAPNRQGGNYLNTDPPYPPLVFGGVNSDVYGRPIVRMDAGSAGNGVIAHGSGVDEASSGVVGKAAASDGDGGGGAVV